MKRCVVRSNTHRFIRFFARCGDQQTAKARSMFDSVSQRHLRWFFGNVLRTWELMTLHPFQGGVSAKSVCSRLQPKNEQVTVWTYATAYIAYAVAYGRWEAISGLRKRP